MAEDPNRNAQGAPSTSTRTTTTHGPTITTTSTSNTAGTGQTTTVTSSATGSLHPTVTTTAPHTTTVVHPTVTTTSRIPFPRTPSSSIATQAGSIRIRRAGADQGTQTTRETTGNDGGRRRSSSEPQRPQWALQPQDDLEIRRQLTATPMQTVHEEGPSLTTPQLPAPTAELAVPQRTPTRPGWGRQLSSISLRPRNRGSVQEQASNVPEYDATVVDMLDVIDPEISTLTTLNNVQNSLFIPNLGSFYRRQPTYDLSRPSPVTSSDEEAAIEQRDDEQGDASQEKDTEEGAQEEASSERPTDLNRMNTISSVLTGMSEGHNYAVLPHGTSLPGWTDEEKEALNDHVRHLLHSRRERFKRSMRGFGRYVRKPVGFLVTLYAFLLTFWGAAWVLFLIGWISVGDRQAYFIEICDQILTALFCVVGIGMAPWRAIDTYHMIYVAKYAHMTWELRRKRGLPKLRDRNELPARPGTHAWETGDEPDPESEEIVLTPERQARLEYHQQKLANSHTFYKPHETNTHHAFSVRLLIAIVVLLDCHSLFQMALGGTTWGIYYKDRPKALTAVILTCSISCNISAGITISVGDHRSRKKMVIEQMFRQGVTEDALKDLRKERGLKVSGLGSKRKQKTHPGARSRL